MASASARAVVGGPWSAAGPRPGTGGRHWHPGSGSRRWAQLQRAASPICPPRLRVLAECARASLARDLRLTAWPIAQNDIPKHLKCPVFAQAALYHRQCSITKREANLADERQAEETDRKAWRHIHGSTAIRSQNSALQPSKGSWHCASLQHAQSRWQRCAPTEATALLLVAVLGARVVHAASFARYATVACLLCHRMDRRHEGSECNWSKCELR